MKKNALFLMLLTALTAAAHGQGGGKPRSQAGFYFDTWILASGFGGDIRIAAKTRTPGYFDIAASLLPGGEESGASILVCHLSRIFPLGKSRDRGLFAGPGVSWSPFVTVPVLHLKVLLLVPLGRNSGFQLGSYPLGLLPAYPFAMAWPDIHAGVYLSF